MLVTRTKHKYDQIREHEYDERVGGNCAACSYAEYFRNLRRCNNLMHVAKSHFISIIHLFQRLEPPENTAADTSASITASAITHL